LGDRIGDLVWFYMVKYGKNGDLVWFYMVKYGTKWRFSMVLDG
jgi:hypothetical protein